MSAWQWVLVGWCGGSVFTLATFAVAMRVGRGPRAEWTAARTLAEHRAEVAP